MKSFQIPEKCEVLGANILSVLAGLGGFKSRGEAFLKEEGIENIKPDVWYNAQKYLNVQKKISEKMGGKTLLSIGRFIIEKAPFPPIKSIEEAWSLFDVAYNMNFRGATNQIGGYKVISSSKNSCKIKCDNPFPCDFDMGMIHGLGKRFLPADSLGLTVEHADSSCRKTGDDCCIYIINW